MNGPTRELHVCVPLKMHRRIVARASLLRMTASSYIREAIDRDMQDRDDRAFLELCEKHDAKVRGASGW